MAKLKMRLDQLTIESIKDDGSPVPDNGYCYVKVDRENDQSWLEIHGNETEAAYPLCLSSESEVDDFANLLKKALR